MGPPGQRREQMERARWDRRIEDCPDRWNDIEVRARLQILRRQRGRFRPACHGQPQYNSGDSVLDTQAPVRREVSQQASKFVTKTRQELQHLRVPASRFELAANSL